MRAILAQLQALACHAGANPVETPPALSEDWLVDALGLVMIEANELRKAEEGEEDSDD